MRATRQIRALALSRQPGAIVVAEQAVDVYAAAFRRLDERLNGLDALSGDLMRLARGEPELAPFLAQVESYIRLLRRCPPLAA